KPAIIAWLQDATVHKMPKEVLNIIAQQAYGIESLVHDLQTIINAKLDLPSPTPSPLIMVDFSYRPQRLTDLTRLNMNALQPQPKLKERIAEQATKLFGSKLPLALKTTYYAANAGLAYLLVQQFRPWFELTELDNASAQDSLTPEVSASTAPTARALAMGAAGAGVLLLDKKFSCLGNQSIA